MISPSQGELSPARFVIFGNNEGPALILIGLEKPQALDPFTEITPPLRPTFTLIVSLSLMLMGVKNALLIGFFAGIMNVIPYIGPLVATALGVMITLSSNMELSFYDEMIPLIVKVLLVFMVTRLIDDIILQPNIFSKSVFRF